VAEHLDLSVDDAARLRRRLTSPESESDEGEPLFGSTRRESVQRAAYEAVRSVVSDLAKEIGLCLRYYSVTFRGARPTALVLVGGEAHEPQLAKVIAEQLEIDVAVADPLTGIDLSSADIAIERRGTLPEWSTAAGLALRWSMPRASRKRGAA
jgi:Tfp pilus assembly PilM family ATPase